MLSVSSFKLQFIFAIHNTFLSLHVPVDSLIVVQRCIFNTHILFSIRDMLHPLLDTIQHVSSICAFHASLCHAGVLLARAEIKLYVLFFSVLLFRTLGALVRCT